MLVNLYKSKTPIAVFTFPLLIGVLGLPIFFSEIAEITPFFSWQTGFIQTVTKNALLHYGIVVLVLYLSGLEMNRLVNTFGFYSKNTYLPGVIFALAVFSLGQVHFSMLILAYGFLIYGLGFLFRINRQDFALKSIFMAGLFFGIAIVFEPVLAPVIVLPWFSLLVFRTFNWREWMVLIVSATVPWFYHIGLHFAFFGKVNMAIENLPALAFDLTFSLKMGVMTVFLILLISYSIWKYLVISNNQLLVFKKRSRLLFHFIWLTLISLGIGWFLFQEHILAVIIPFSIIVAVQMLNARTALYSNLVILIWMALIAWTLFF